MQAQHLWHHKIKNLLTNFPLSNYSFSETRIWNELKKVGLPHIRESRCLHIIFYCSMENRKFITWDKKQNRTERYMQWGSESIPWNQQRSNSGPRGCRRSSGRQGWSLWDPSLEAQLAAICIWLLREQWHSYRVSGKKNEISIRIKAWENEERERLPREPAIIKADWTKNMTYPGYNPCNYKFENRRAIKERSVEWNKQNDFWLRIDCLIYTLGQI